MLLDSTTDSEDVFRAPMVFRRSRASRESPPTFTSSLWLPEARVTAGQGACQESQCGGAGRGQGREAASALSGAFPTPPCCGHKGVGRGGPVATVGLQGQRVDPRRRWHNWKNRGGNSAGGCVRDALTAEGVLQEGVVADGVEGGVEGPVQPAQHGQQQQSGERLQELRDLPRSSGEGWARSPLRRVCPPPLRAAPRPRASPGSSFPRPGWRGRRGR